jgi:hypothetical protein
MPTYWRPLVTLYTNEDDISLCFWKCLSTKMLAEINHAKNLLLVKTNLIKPTTAPGSVSSQVKPAPPGRQQVRPNHAPPQRITEETVERKMVRTSGSLKARPVGTFGLISEAGF